MASVTTQEVLNNPTKQPQALDTAETKQELDFPPGYRFRPTDEELVGFYLKKKVSNAPLPVNRIVEVNLYRYNPESLAEKYKDCGETEWYFFTPRNRKYRNGNRPNRAAGDGYWKATGADKLVESDGNIVGFRKALVFYKGKPLKGDKTNWIMHEYRVNGPPRSRRVANDMRLDDWVLCRIYKKTGKSTKTSTREEVVDSTSMHDDVTAGPETMVHAGDHYMQQPLNTGVLETAQFNNAVLGGDFHDQYQGVSGFAKMFQPIGFRSSWAHCTENVDDW